jgi:hypothetical protein
MLKEQLNVEEVRPDQKPESGGLTLIAQSTTSTSQELLTKIKSVWSVAASWGRYFDEELGDWPAVEECLNQLPDWFKIELSFNPNLAERWIDALHDRDWAWWSGCLIGEYVKIDVEVESRPASFWALLFVIEKSGGTIIYKDTWIGSAEFNNRLRSGLISESE